MARAVRIRVALGLSNVTGIWLSSAVLIGAVLVILVLAMRS
jgi:hypothetical protein